MEEVISSNTINSEAASNNQVVPKPHELEVCGANPLAAMICSKCNNLKKIYCKGMCKSCYNYIHRDRDKQKISVIRWKEKNKDYWKNYHLNKKVINDG